MISTILCTKTFFDAGTVRYIISGTWLVVFGPAQPEAESTQPETVREFPVIALTATIQ